MLDPQGRKEMFDVIFNLRKENPNMSILSITHHIDEAIFADEIVVINKGMIIKKGTATEILEDINLLQQHNLDAPFTIKLIDKLQKNGFKVNKTLLANDIEVTGIYESGISLEDYFDSLIKDGDE